MRGLEDLLLGQRAIRDRLDVLEHELRIVIERLVHQHPACQDDRGDATQPETDFEEPAFVLGGAPIRTSARFDRHLQHLTNLAGFAARLARLPARTHAFRNLISTHG